MQSSSSFKPKLLYRGYWLVKSITAIIKPKNTLTNDNITKSTLSHTFKSFVKKSSAPA